jgi:hypothetical protein
LIEAGGTNIVVVRDTVVVLVDTLDAVALA